MARPTPEEARRRIAAVEVRLQNATPIWRSRDRDLYQSRDGYYVVRYREAERVTYLGISVDGEIRDLAGYDTDGVDVEIAISCFHGAELAYMRERIVSWPHRHPR